MISDDFFLKTIIVPFLIQQVGYSAEWTTLGDATTSVTSKNSNSILPQLWCTYVSQSSSEIERHVALDWWFE